MFDDQLDEEDRQLAMLDEQRSMAEQQASKEILMWCDRISNLNAAAVLDCICIRIEGVAASIASEAAQKDSTIFVQEVFDAIKDNYVAIRTDQIIEEQRKCRTQKNN